jgi:tetratricopeptide (TPR) repeat protein
VVTAVSVVALLLVAGASFVIGHQFFKEGPSGRAPQQAWRLDETAAPATARAFLVAAAGEMLRNQPSRARTLLLWAAEWLDDPSEQALPHLLRRAEIAVHLGRHEEALATLDVAARLGTKRNDPEIVATTLARTAQILIAGLLEPERGRTVLSEARGAAELAATALVEVRVRQVELVSALLVKADYDEALSIARGIQALSVGDDGEPGLRAAGHEALGLAYEARYAAGQGEAELLHQARTAYDAAVRQWTRAGDDRGLARALTGRGRVALLRGEPAASLPPLMRAADLNQREGELRGLALSRANLALAELELGRPEKALVAIELALAEAERRADPFLSFDSQAVKGRILVRLNRLEEGLAVLRSALVAGRMLYPTGIRNDHLAQVEELISTAPTGGADGSRRVVASGLY